MRRSRLDMWALALIVASGLLAASVVLPPDGRPDAASSPAKVGPPDLIPDCAERQNVPFTSTRPGPIATLVPGSSLDGSPLLVRNRYVLVPSPITPNPSPTSAIAW
jgi:hypothetical protein